MSFNIKFKKSGKEIKVAVHNRIKQIKERLDKRNKALDEFLKDPVKLRSYLIRSAYPEWRGGHGGSASTLYSKDDISSEEKQEIQQLCSRIFELEQEMHRLHLVVNHLDDDEEFMLPFEDLVAYGFESTVEYESQ